MLEIDKEDRDYFLSQVRFALESAQLDQFLAKLNYLRIYSDVEDDGRNVRCLLARDFAPHSFRFAMQRRKQGATEFTHWFNGGLIYQGPEHPADGSFPSLTVSLAKGTGWFVHT